MHTYSRCEEIDTQILTSLPVTLFPLFLFQALWLTREDNLRACPFRGIFLTSTMSYITMQPCDRGGKSKLGSLMCCRGSWFLSFMWLTCWQQSESCILKKKQKKKKSLDLIVGRFLLLRKKRHVCQKIETESGQLPKRSEKTQRREGKQAGRLDPTT